MRWLLLIGLFISCLAAESVAESEYAMPLKLKVGVNPAKVVPEMLLGNQIVCSVFQDRHQDCIITSMHDGKHGPNSLHSRDGLCRAIDYRTKHLSDMEKTFIINALKDALGEQYDVVLENLGQPNEHVHVEWDPKPSMTAEV